jgi:hypothetical protein
MPFVNLPDKHESRWGESLTAEKMKKCIWLRPEAVALKSSSWNGLRQIGSGTRNVQAYVKTKMLVRS